MLVLQMTIVPALLLSEDSTLALLPLLIIFGAAKILGELAEKLRQPPVVGELAAGILVGPAVLNWVQPGGTIGFLAEMGVLFLMFQVGLELRDFRLRKLGARALGIAVCGVVLPFVAGFYLTRAFGYHDLSASFVGAAMVATSVGITARVLAAQGWLDQAASRIILTAAIIDDVLGLLVLSVVSSQAHGDTNILELGASVELAIGFTLIVAAWGQSTIGRAASFLNGRISRGSRFAVAVILLLSLSLAATHVGVAAIIGAFLAGMAVANSADQQVHSMVHGVTELLVPFFLAGIGLNLERSLFVNPQQWTFFVALTVLACVTKFIGCATPALGLGRADAVRIGVGMMPRGEVGMVVAQVGLSLEVITRDIYAAVVVMAIATTMIAPPLLRRVYGIQQQTCELIDLPRVG